MNANAAKMAKLKYFASPQGINDFNAFLENLPRKAGQTVLVAAGIAWAAAAAGGVFTAMQLKNLSELRAELKEAEALKPVVPVIEKTPVSKEEVDAFVETLRRLYPDLQIQTQRSGIMISTNDINMYPYFREAIGHVQNGGKSWRVSISSLCGGRECENQKFQTVLKIDTLSVDKPGE